jgi:biopolymer transport protein ExbD
MPKGEVEIMITPMLDMAFQLLTFFILTYQPAPVEGQFSMNLLPSAPAIDINAKQETSGEAKGRDDIPAALRTLTTLVYANNEGKIGRMMIGENEYPSLEQLEARLKEIVADKTLPFDQAVIQSDPALRYEELMKIINVFAGPEVNLTKLDFKELNPAGAPAL